MGWYYFLTLNFSILRRSMVERHEIKINQFGEQYGGKDASSPFESNKLYEAIKIIENIVRENFSSSSCLTNSIELELIASLKRNVDISLSKSICKSILECSYEDKVLSLDDETVGLIESQFLVVHNTMLQFDAVNCWNKAKLIVFMDSNCSSLVRFKYDSDLDWVESLDVNGYQYNELSAGIEEKINQWEGLPTDFIRIWIH